MGYLDVLILSIVEGLSEFLPISSTGHLLLTARILNIVQSESVKSFEIFIQLGAILAIVLLYWRDLLISKKLIAKIFVAFIPTAIVGLLLYQFIKEYLFENLMVVFWALIIGGVVLMFFEKFLPKNKESTNKIEDLSWRDAFLIGAAQSVSVIPGVSRAGATIVGGMFFGLNREQAVKFSFLLAVPTIFAATLLDLIKTEMIFTNNLFYLFILGFICSFISALIVVRFLVNFVRNHNFVYFGIYRIVLAIIFWWFFIS